MNGIEPINPKMPRTNLTNFPLAPILHSNIDIDIVDSLKI